jgi:hypothetical protein
MFTSVSLLTYASSTRSNETIPAIDRGHQQPPDHKFQWATEDVEAEVIP